MWGRTAVRASGTYRPFHDSLFQTQCRTCVAPTTEAEQQQDLRPKTITSTGMAPRLQPVLGRVLRHIRTRRRCNRRSLDGRFLTSENSWAAKRAAAACSP
jgi:hypothetical protein